MTAGANRCTYRSKTKTQCERRMTLTLALLSPVQQHINGPAEVVVTMLVNEQERPGRNPLGGELYRVTHEPCCGRWHVTVLTYAEEYVGGRCLAAAICRLAENAAVSHGMDQ